MLIDETVALIPPDSIVEMWVFIDETVTLIPPDRIVEM